jgi:CRISPR type III-A-associated protein Csm2
MEKPKERISESVLNTGIREVKLLMDWGHFLGEDDPHGPKKLTSSQIRRFFGAVKKIQADFEHSKNEIILLNPKLAYAVGRDYDKNSRRNKTKIKELYELLNPLINSIDEKSERFRNFVSVFESIVAYHKEKCGD